ncbi:hypothetical protein [Cellulomonas sp.]|uniref:hypothetical protein n=1 Tax=Cellulomonas sp. TaxID=40001 RepID=UPI003BAB73EE
MTLADLKDQTPLSRCLWCDQGEPQVTHYDTNDLGRAAYAARSADDFERSAVVAALRAAIEERLALHDRHSLEDHARLVGWAPRSHGRVEHLTCVGWVGHDGIWEQGHVASFVALLINPEPRRQTRLERELKELYRHLRSLGESLTCARPGCSHPITPDDAYELGHNDLEPSRFWGPEHAGCNRRGTRDYLIDHEILDLQHRPLPTLFADVVLTTRLGVDTVACLLDVDEELAERWANTIEGQRRSSWDDALRLVIAAHYAFRPHRRRATAVA